MSGPAWSFLDRLELGLNIAPIRVEVIEARRSRKGGAIVLARPVPMKVAAAIGSAIVLAFVLLLVFGEYSSKVRVKGRLVYAGGAIKAVAPQFGRIIARHVREGEPVNAGQVLFDLSAERIGGAGSIDARITASLAMRREQIVQRRDATLQQLALRAAALADQARLVESEIAAHLGGVAIEDELVKSAQASVDRNSTLASQGFVSVAGLAQQKNILNVERAILGEAALTKALQNSGLAAKLPGPLKLAGIAIGVGAAYSSIMLMERDHPKNDNKTFIDKDGVRHMPRAMVPDDDTSFTSPAGGHVAHMMA